MQPFTKKCYGLSIFGCQRCDSVSKFLHIGFVCGTKSKFCVVRNGVLKDKLLIVTSAKCVCVVCHVVEVN